MLTLDDYKPGYADLFAANLREEMDWEPNYVKAVVADALRFLRVCADHPDERLVSSVDVDQAVDRMVLDTPLYRWLSKRLGRFVDHVPTYAHEKNPMAQALAYTTTIAYMRETGPVDPHIWRELPAACGGTGCLVVAGCWQSCRMVA